MAEHNTLEIVKAAASAAMSRRAQDGVILDLRELDCFTDFFAIFSGVSDIQVEGISQAVLEELETNWEQRPWHQEGERKADWILLDYVDFVVHVFLAERRAYYNLERLWAEAGRIELPELAMPAHLESLSDEASEGRIDPDGALVFGGHEEGVSEE
ncbi:ribosome silencing factor [Candidatus Poribacteria bacterium]|nr:ribosome silencing factor [Candidatus Poribacteria bacterium]MXY27457.1 ribosome silencing factor [Candidatus Poribacteria bacterium]MYK18436.1 ribosome silencing factor [Candidatus Poribacteria bacterium]